MGGRTIGIYITTTIIAVSIGLTFSEFTDLNPGYILFLKKPELEMVTLIIVIILRSTKKLLKHKKKHGPLEYHIERLGSREYIFFCH